MRARPPREELCYTDDSLLDLGDAQDSDHVERSKAIWKCSTRERGADSHGVASWSGQVTANPCKEWMEDLRSFRSEHTLECPDSGKKPAPVTAIGMPKESVLAKLWTSPAPAHTI